MLNNGHMSGGIPDGGPPPGHPMYGHHGGGNGGPGGGGGNGGDYPGNPSTFLGPSPPGSMNGIGGSHHSGGYCSQMSLNQNPCGPQSPAQCSYCANPILERYYLQALDRFWHHNCLKCTSCGTTLADIGRSCFERDGMLLCRTDYFRLFGGNGSSGACQGCGQGIPASELVMRAGVSPPGSSPPFVYHLKCFTCSKCHCTFSPGDRYSVLNGVLYCEQDAIKLMKNGIGSPSANVAPTNNGPAPRKGKVGRPRRSRD